MHVFFLHLAALLAFLLIDLPAYALPVCPPKPIVVGVQELGLHYSDGFGLDMDVIEELKKRSKCEFALVIMPRNRIFMELEAGRLDMTTSVLPTPERLKSMRIYNYMQTKFYALGRTKYAMYFTSMQYFEQIGDQKIGVVRGMSFGPVLDEEVAKLAAKGRVVEVSQMENLFKMLAAHRMTVILASPMAYRKYLFDEGIEDGVTIVDWDLKTNARPRGLALSKTTFSEKSALEWGSLINAMNHDGTMKLLIGKYLNKQETLDAIYKP